MIMDFTEYSTLVDTGLVIGLVLIVWVAYREMRRRTHAEREAAQISNSAGHRPV
jgi:hypothetical protein